MTKMDCLYSGTSPFMQRYGQHRQAPVWQQGLPKTATQEVTTWQCQTTTAAVSTHSLLPTTGALPPCWLHKLPSAGGIGVPGVSFSSTGFVWLWGHCTKWDLSNSSCRAGLIYHSWKFLEVLRDSAVPWQLTLPSSP